MVAREEDVGDFEAAEVGRLGVLGVFEVVAVGEAFDQGGGFATEDAGEEAGDTVDDDEGGEFAAGEDVIAERDFVVDDGQNALVVAFVVRAKDDEMALWGFCGAIGGGVRSGDAGKLADEILVPGHANRGRENDLSVGAGRLDALDGGKNRLAAQQHAVTAAVRGVVDGFVRAESKIAQVDVLNRNNSPVLRLVEHRALEVGLECLGKKGDDGELDFGHTI